MKYFDANYIVKCYLRERGTDEVRRLAESGEPLASCELARAEFSAAVHRHRREKKISEKEASLVFRRFRSDVQAGHWTFLPLTSRILEECASAFERLPIGVFLRTADAVHLICAREHGFKAVYSNDTHLCAAAPHFGLRAVDVVA